MKTKKRNKPISFDGTAQELLSALLKKPKALKKDAPKTKSKVRGING